MKHEGNVDLITYLNNFINKKVNKYQVYFTIFLE